MLERCAWLAVAAALLAAAAPSLSGCRCGGGGIGERCSENADCDPGLYCDPGLMVCVAVGDSGGAGTDAGNCDDADGDGVTGCAGDCDDGDPLTYPGAPEVCGDAVDNGCGAMPEQGCGGLGTFVAPPPLGDDANPGTQALPVATIAQGIANATTIGGGADVYVAAGSYAEPVTMVDGVSLLGGHESAGWTRDPSVNASVIEGAAVHAVLVPGTVGAGTELSGFTVNGMAGGESAVDVANGASVAIRDNVLVGPANGALSVVVRVNPGGAPNAGATPEIVRNVVRLGAGGAGGFPNGSMGVRIETTPALVSGNQVELVSNDIRVWGILSWSAVPGLVIEGNRVRGAASGMNFRATGIEIGSTGAVVDRNDVAMGACVSDCVGIAAEAVLATITNNVVFGGNGATSAALRLAYEAMPIPPDVLIHSNYFNGGGAPGLQRTSIGVDLVNLAASALVAGRLINNVIESGVADYRYCISESQAGMDPERLEANLLWVSPTPAGFVSGLYRDEYTSTLMMLSAVNALPETTGVANLSSDPMLVMPVVDGDFHTLPGSPCIDAGATTELPATDFEGDPRPAGAAPDIGPDER